LFADGIVCCTRLWYARHGRELMRLKSSVRESRYLDSRIAKVPAEGKETLRLSSLIRDLPSPASRIAEGEGVTEEELRSGGRTRRVFLSGGAQEDGPFRCRRCTVSRGDDFGSVPGGRPRGILGPEEIPLSLFKNTVP